MSSSSTPRDHPVNLDVVAFSHCKVDSVADFNPQLNNQILPPNHIIELAKDPTAKERIQFKLRTIYNPDKNPAGPYSIDAECVVQLTFLQELASEEEQQRLALSVGHNVAIGAMREHIATVTSRHVNGTLFLGLSALNVTPERAETRKAAGPRTKAKESKKPVANDRGSAPAKKMKRQAKQ